MESKDHRDRTCLSSKGAAGYLGTTVRRVCELARSGALRAVRAASGQPRFDLADVRALEAAGGPRTAASRVGPDNRLSLGGTVQRLLVKSSARMDDLPDGSAHLMMSSPPCFDTKIYSREHSPGDPGGVLINNMHEFILEFEKPAPRGQGKYAHLTERQKELSRLDRDPWLSIRKSDVRVMKPSRPERRRRASPARRRPSPPGGPCPSRGAGPPGRGRSSCPR